MTEKTTKTLKNKGGKKTSKSGTIDYGENVNPKHTPNDISNIILKLKEKNAPEVWEEITLPSNGKAEYEPVVKIREMKTEDEKILIKELYSNREKAIGNLMRKCVQMPSGLDIDNLTNFDQAFILVELSAITFPGEKTYEVEDEEGNKISLSVDRDELVLTSVEEEEVPFKLTLPAAGITWYLDFLTVSDVKEIDKIMKTGSLKDDMLMRMLITIAKITNHIELTESGQEISIDTWYDYTRLIQELKASDVKILTECLNDIILTKYGYKLTKEVYSPHTMSTQVVEVDPLNFFRLSF